MLRRIFLLLLLVTSLLLLAPTDRAPKSFDKGRNGIWIGHQWYTGLNVRTGTPVPDAERLALVRRLRENGFRHVYLHAGPLLPDGSIRDRPGPDFRVLLREAPDLVFLAWIGGNAERFALKSSCFRQSVIATVIRLRDEGFQGVHLDIEPLRDGHPGYLALLRDLRSALGKDFILSHATRRAGPFGFAKGPLKRWFWSERFYRDAMALTDETVLMAYDTTLDSGLLYAGFVRHETRLLLKWGVTSPATGCSWASPRSRTPRFPIRRRRTSRTPPGESARPWRISKVKPPASKASRCTRSGLLRRTSGGSSGRSGDSLVDPDPSCHILDVMEIVVEREEKHLPDREPAERGVGQPESIQLPFPPI